MLGPNAGLCCRDTPLGPRITRLSVTLRVRCLRYGTDSGQSRCCVYSGVSASMGSELRAGYSPDRKCKAANSPVRGCIPISGEPSARLSVNSSYCSRITCKAVAPGLVSGERPRCRASGCFAQLESVSTSVSKSEDASEGPRARNGVCCSMHSYRPVVTECLPRVRIFCCPSEFPADLNMGNF